MWLKRMPTQGGWLVGAATRNGMYDIQYISCRKKAEIDKVKKKFSKYAQSLTVSHRCILLQEIIIVIAIDETACFCLTPYARQSYLTPPHCMVNTPPRPSTLHGQYTTSPLHTAWSIHHLAPPHCMVNTPPHPSTLHGQYTTSPIHTAWSIHHLAPPHCMVNTPPRPSTLHGQYTTSPLHTAWSIHHLAPPHCIVNTPPHPSTLHVNTPPRLGQYTLHTGQIQHCEGVPGLL